MKRRPLARLLGLLPLLGACEPEVATTRPPVPPAASVSRFVQQLDSLLPAWLETYGVPGAAVALVDGGRIVHLAGYGKRSLEAGEPVTPRTVFLAASISKAVTAWGVLRLVQADSLELDAPVQPYLRRWKLPPSRHDETEVTVRRLLSHTAGISVHHYDPLPADRPVPTLEERLRGRGWRSSAVRVVVSPGSEFRYSGGGYSILELLVEEVTRRPFAEYMQDAVLSPLGMTRSGFARRPAFEEDAAVPYGGAHELHRSRPVAMASGGLYTTAEDLARFALAELGAAGSGAPGSGAAGLSDSTRALMHSPAPSTGGLYGLGHELWPGVRGAGHTGSQWGWRAILLLLPERGKGLVVLTNSDNGSGVVFATACHWTAWATEISPEAACPEEV